MKATPGNDNLEQLLEQSYEEAKNHHEDLALNQEVFKQRLLAMIQRHNKQRREEASSIESWLRRLHTKDLYLAFACAQSIEEAWIRFGSLYHKPVYEAALLVCRNRSQADEIARSVVGHLFLPDAKGSMRIESYSGLSSLLTWVRVIITNKAVDELRHKCRYTDRFEDVLEIVDEAGTPGAHRTVRMALYERLIQAALQEAPQILNEQEKLILKLRYKNELKMGEIAALVGATQPNLTYRLKRTHKKLKKEVVSILQKRHHLSEAAIKECIDEILENPAYSILDFLQ
jgi:RNA polymerase sigma-70 factor, ECF subfamily